MTDAEIMEIAEQFQRKGDKVQPDQGDYVQGEANAYRTCAHRLRFCLEDSQRRRKRKKAA